MVSFNNWGQRVYDVINYGKCSKSETISDYSSQHTFIQTMKSGINTTHSVYDMI